MIWFIDRDPPTAGMRAAGCAARDAFRGDGPRWAVVTGDPATGDVSFAHLAASRDAAMVRAAILSGRDAGRVTVMPLREGPSCRGVSGRTRRRISP